MKLLVVDDHALFRSGLRMLLAALDPSATVIEAANLADALHQARGHPDLRLCLLDLRLQDGCGLRAIESIRNAAPAAAVVIVSGSESGATIRDCIEAGAMAYIPKSATPEVLIHALRRTLAGESFLPEGMLHAGEVAKWRPVLSPRQRDVLRCLGRGLPTKLIARELGLSEHTVKEYITAIFAALQVRNRTEAVIKASRLDLRDQQLDPQTPLDPRERW